MRKLVAHSNALNYFASNLNTRQFSNRNPTLVEYSSVLSYIDRGMNLCEYVYLTNCIKQGNTNWCFYSNKIKQCQYHGLRY